MRLEAFQVQNYKKIRDTGWVSCRDLTVFVGKNEAGKSAIFRGLSKLNPSDGEKYDGLREFPRRRYTDEFSSQDWPVATGCFTLNEEEVKQLATIDSRFKDVKKIIVTRHYSWKLATHFEPMSDPLEVSLSELQKNIVLSLEQIQEMVAPDGKGDVLGNIKTTLKNALEQSKNAIKGDGVASKAQIDSICNTLTGQANEEWQKQLLGQMIKLYQDLSKRAGAYENAVKWVLNNLPRFIYFDKYDVIDSAIHIPTFLQQVNANPSPPRARTTHCLFKYVGLDVNKLSGLGRHQPGTPEDSNIKRQVDERSILTSSASNAMTQKFEDWWEQRKHKFHYRIDGDYFRIWVSDDLDPSEIELDQRSSGMQYFFSFFTVFLVETQGAHTNSILLLDEPGLHVHGTAQAKVVKFLEKLSKDNQTLFTTHSPFMVDSDHLERIRVVYESEDGTTKVSEDVWPRDKDSLFPLQAALGYQLVQGLFFSRHQVIVEGLTDLWLLKALNQALAAKGRTTLKPDIVIVPAAGLTKLLPLASMLIGHDIDTIALLDGDEPARKEGKKLVDKLLVGEERKCIFIGDFVDNKNAEIEDIFPQDEYVSMVEAAYPKLKIHFTESEKAITGVVNKIQAVFERNNLGHFEKWRVAEILRDRIVDAPDKVNDKTLDAIERIYSSLNSLFPKC